jgi:hypothetical protein
MGREKDRKIKGWEDRWIENWWMQNMLIGGLGDGKIGGWENKTMIGYMNRVY